MAPRISLGKSRRTVPEVWFRIVHIAADHVKGSLGLREQTVEVALGPDGAFENGNIGVLTRQVPAGDDLGGIMRTVFPLFGVPFIVVGFGLCFGPSIIATAGLKNAEYLVTDKRVLVRGGASKITITHAPLADVTSVTSSGGAVGSVTLAFASPPSSRLADGKPAINTDKTLVFDSIPNPSQVRVLVEDAVRRAKEGKGK